MNDRIGLGWALTVIFVVAGLGFWVVQRAVNKQESPAWYTISTKKSSYEFQLTSSKALTWTTMPRAVPNVKDVIDGKFAASTPWVHAIVITPADFARVRRGYPPLDVEASLSENVPFSVVPKPGLNVVYFFQAPPNPDLSKATSIISLLMMSIKGLADDSTPAAVSVEFTSKLQVFGTREQAEDARSHVVPNPAESR